MFGGIFIIVGIIILLEVTGVISASASGLVWGIAFIAIGVMMMIRRTMRQGRREEWMMQHGRGRHGQHPKDDSTSEEDQGK